MTVNSEKRADFKNCMRGDYNQDEETFRFIIEFLEVNQDSLKLIKDNWDIIDRSGPLINAMLKIDADNGLRMFFHKLLPSAESAIISLLTMTIATIGLAALSSGADAGIECLPKLID
jgi:hypothetical protein